MSQVPPVGAANASDRALFFSGEYGGWARPVDGEFEDMIGAVRIACSVIPGEPLRVTIVSLDFGTWLGQMPHDRNVITGPTGQNDTYFKLEFDDRRRAGFHGGIYGPSGRVAIELELYSLAHEARRFSFSSWLGRVFGVD
jgi:hypothetical protein